MSVFLLNSFLNDCICKTFWCLHYLHTDETCIYFLKTFIAIESLFFLRSSDDHLQYANIFHFEEKQNRNKTKYTTFYHHSFSAYQQNVPLSNNFRYGKAILSFSFFHSMKSNEEKVVCNKTVLIWQWWIFM